MKKDRERDIDLIAAGQASLEVIGTVRLYTTGPIH